MFTGFLSCTLFASRNGPPSRVSKNLLAVDSTTIWARCTVPSLLFSITSQRWSCIQNCRNCCMMPALCSAGSAWSIFTAPMAQLLHEFFMMLLGWGNPSYQQVAPKKSSAVRLLFYVSVNNSSMYIYIHSICVCWDYWPIFWRLPGCWISFVVKLMWEVTQTIRATVGYPHLSTKKVTNESYVGFKNAPHIVV